MGVNATANVTQASTADTLLRTETRYDPAGNVAALVLYNTYWYAGSTGTGDPQITAYGYDALGRRVRESVGVVVGQTTWLSSRNTTTEYSRAGDALTVTDPLGQTQWRDATDECAITQLTACQSIWLLRLEPFVNKWHRWASPTPNEPQAPSRGDSKVVHAVGQLIDGNPLEDRPCCTRDASAVRPVYVR